MDKYTIGIDFGTLSARALMVRINDGSEVASAEYVYPHAIMTEKDIDGSENIVTTALQHPKDYIDALSYTVKKVLSDSAVDASCVLGLGIDFTSCTVLPVKKDLTPLCFDDEFKKNKHAYVKLWKHHGANDVANRMTDIAKSSGEKWLDDYGGAVSSEWLIPKITETLERSESVYNAAEYFMDAGDWLVSLITGKVSRSCCIAGFKAQWNAQSGHLSDEYLQKVNAKLKGLTKTKLKGDVLPVGICAGKLNEYGAKLTSLNENTSVSVAVIDAHAALPSAGVTESGALMLILGTSACHILLSKKDVKIGGICGKVLDGVVKGYYAYESGQGCFGDVFDWFKKTCVPNEYFENAKVENVDIFTYLNKKAKDIPIGNSGLLALDWFNGNRSPYADYDLSGMILGLNLSTTPEEIYQALVCSVVFGTKRIVDLYVENGLDVDKITAAGGIAGKNDYLMQVMADVLGKKISVVDNKQAGAKGSAIYAAAACGYYDSVKSAADTMKDGVSRVYLPNSAHTERYEKLYKHYVELSEYFAKSNSVMKKLKF